MTESFADRMARQSVEAAEAQKRDDLIEEATWALIEWDTDTADRGVSDEHYRDRRADVERVFPILFRRAEPQVEPSDAQRIVVQEVSRLAGMQLLRRYSAFSDHWWDELYAGIARVVCAAGGAR